MGLQIFTGDYPQSAASGGKIEPWASIAALLAGWLWTAGLALQGRTNRY